MTGLELRHWAHSWDFTHGEAATALGIGRSSFCKYIKQLRVPEFVRLACMGHDHEKKVTIETEWRALKRDIEEIARIADRAKARGGSS